MTGVNTNSEESVIFTSILPILTYCFVFYLMAYQPSRII